MTRRFVFIATAFLLPIALLASPTPQVRSAYEGRPAFKEGSDKSYFVWSDGNRWHVRWTTQGVMRQFSGSVRTAGGELEDLKRIDVDEELRVINAGRPPRVVRGPRGRAVGVAPGRPAVVASRDQDHIDKIDDHLIRWVAHTDRDIDGFDFSVKPAADTLTFQLLIAGESRAVNVEIGKNNIHPKADPFVVRLK